MQNYMVYLKKTVKALNEKGLMAEVVDQIEQNDTVTCSGR